MEISAVTAAWFSPTGGTETAALTIGEALAEALSVPLNRINLTTPGERAAVRVFSETELAVIASPTYAGRLPNKISPDFRRILRGEGTFAAPVVTFGNRAFDNSLAELCSLLAENGFLPVSAAAFAARHAFTDALGRNRPGENDRREMADFARRTAEKVQRLTAVEYAAADGIPDGEGRPVPALSVPGNPDAPYYVPQGTDGKPAKFLKAKPKTDLSRCCHCGVCVRLCPMGAIDTRDSSLINGTCIKCQSCVRRCTRRAKYFDDPAFLSHTAMLEAAFREPKENRVFL